MKVPRRLKKKVNFLYIHFVCWKTYIRTYLAFFATEFAPVQLARELNSALVRVDAGIQCEGANDEQQVLPTHGTQRKKERKRMPSKCDNDMQCCAFVYVCVCLSASVCMYVRLPAKSK